MSTRTAGGMDSAQTGNEGLGFKGSGGQDNMVRGLGSRGVAMSSRGSCLPQSTCLLVWCVQQLAGHDDQCGTSTHAYTHTHVHAHTATHARMHTHMLTHMTNLAELELHYKFII